MAIFYVVGKAVVEEDEYLEKFYSGFFDQVAKATPAAAFDIAGRSLRAADVRRSDGGRRDSIRTDRIR